MVLLASAVCTKDGKTLVSRHFVELNRSRIEGLLAAFPKLIGSSMQHTFVETESVRYVYQPLEQLYVLLITTKASNILEDLETLRMFAKVIPEFSHGLTEYDILNNAFDLIFAFDEIVALGYRESVNLSTICTYMKMDSEEEKHARAKRELQEREAKEISKRKQKEMQAKAKEQAKFGKMGAGSRYGGYGHDASLYSNNSGGSVGMPITTFNDEPSPTANNNFKTKINSPSISNMSSGKALKLGSKSKNVDTFVDQLKAEGERVADNKDSGKTTISDASSSVVTNSNVPMQQNFDLHDLVHCRVEEKMMLSASRDGGLDSFEVIGNLSVRIKDSAYVETRLKVDAIAAVKRGALLQTHPNIDKQLFNNDGILQIKQGGKPYPINQEAGVLKWRFQSQEDSKIPLTINCWPNEVSSGGCEVNIEYDLIERNLELHNVVISIPLPSGTKNPTIEQCEVGNYEIDTRHSKLTWCLPLIDSSAHSGQMEFSVKSGHVDDFFPINVSFTSSSSYCGLDVLEAFLPTGSSAKFPMSKEIILIAEKYEIS